MALLVGAAAALATGCGSSSGAVAEPSADPGDAIWVLDIEDCASRPGRRATAFVVDAGAGPVLVSVAHALEGARSVSAIGPDGEALDPLIVRYLDTDTDIGVFSAPAPALPLSLELDARPAAAEVWTRRDPDESTSTVEVDVLRWVDVELDGAGKRLGLELARPASAAENGDLIRSGDSGAPVVDPSNGRVIGMVFAAARTGDRGWATAAVDLGQVLADVPPNQTVELTCETSER